MQKCPHCANHAMSNSQKLRIGVMSEYQCDACGKPVSLHALGSVIAFVVVTALAILGRQLEGTYFYVASAALIIASILCLLFAVPLVKSARHGEAQKS